MKMRVRFILAVVAVLVCLGAGIPHATGVLRIGYNPDLNLHERLRQALAMLGLEVEFVSLPPKRSLAEANEGVLDGELGRIGGLSEDYPNLVIVDVELFHGVGRAYVLKESPYRRFDVGMLKVVRVGSVRGTLWAERLMGDLGLETVNNYETLFNMLLAGRIDVALCGDTNYEEAIGADRTRLEAIRRLDPPVYVTPLYLYLNKKHADIVPALEKTLLEMSGGNGWHDIDTEHTPLPVLGPDPAEPPAQ
jgi:polar amino acid transport system substrate-binding protein